jgi:hypothetical protein
MTSGVLVALVVAQATAAHDPLAIESDSSCPSADAVRAALVGLRPVEDWPPARVFIAAQDQSLLVSMGSPATTQRRLNVEPDCDARAATVALVIATWLGELPAEAVVAPVSAESPPMVRGEALSSAPDPGPPTQSSRRREVGAGVLAETGSGLSPGLRLEVLGLVGQGIFGWQASLVLPAARELTVGPGRTTFRRTSASASLLGRRVAGKLFLSADAGAALGYTSASGSDYQENQTDKSLTYGLLAGLRGGVLWGRARLWIDGRLFRWLYGQTVEVDGLASTAVLPSWDLQCAVGASYAF